MKQSDPYASIGNIVEQDPYEAMGAVQDDESLHSSTTADTAKDPYEGLAEVEEADPYEGLAEVEQRGFIDRNVTGPLAEGAKAAVRGAVAVGTGLGPGMMQQQAEVGVSSIDDRIAELDKQIAIGETQVSRGRRPNVQAPQPTAGQFIKSMFTGESMVDAQREKMREFKSQETRPEDIARLDELRAEREALIERRPEAVAKADKWRETTQRWADASVSGWLEPQDDPSTAEWLTSTIAGAVPSAATMLGVSLIGGSGAGTLVLGQVQGVNEYLEARKAGLSVDEASRVLAAETLLTAAQEWMPIEKLLKGIDGTRIVRGIKQGSTEALQELADTMKSNLIAEHSYDPTRGLFDNWKEAVVGGFGSGGIMGALSPSTAQPQANQQKAVAPATEATPQILATLRESYSVTDPEVLDAIDRRLREAQTDEEVAAVRQDIVTYLEAEGFLDADNFDAVPEQPAAEAQPVTEEQTDAPQQEEVPPEAAPAVEPQPEQEVIADEVITDEPVTTPEGEPVPSEQPVIDQRPEAGNRGFRVRYRSDGSTPLIDFVAGEGGIRARGKNYEGGEYDDAPALSQMGGFGAILYGGRSNRPDQMAQMAYDAGLIEDPYASTLWTKIGEEMQSYRKRREQEALEMADAKDSNKQAQQQGRAFKQDVLTVRKRRESVPVSELKAGDQVTIGRTKLNVTEIDPDTGDVILEDGKKYGVQIVSDGQVLYVDKAKVTPVEDVISDIDAFFESEGFGPQLELLQEQEQPASAVRAENPQTGQTEFIGQDEGGFKLVGQEGADYAARQRDQQEADQIRQDAEARQGRLFKADPDVDWKAKRREVVNTLGPEYAKEYDRRVESGGGAAAAAWADTVLAPEVALGDGTAAVRNESGAWMLRDEQLNEDVRLDPADPDHAEILKVVDPMGNRSGVEQAVDGLQKDWKGPVRVKVVPDASAVPDASGSEVRARIGQNGAEGVFIQKKGQKPVVYLFSDSVTPQRAVAVALHEAVGHAGLRAVMGSRFDTVLDQVFNGMPGRQLVDIAARYELDLTTQEGRREAAEEWMAQLAENRSDFPGMWQRVAAAVRQWLRDIGIVTRVSDNDIAVMLGRARKRIEGGGKVTDGDVVRFSRPSPTRSDAVQKDALVQARKNILKKEGKKLSQFTERMARDKRLTVEQARAALLNPASERVPQNLAEMREALSTMSGATLDKMITFSPNIGGPVETQGQVTAGMALAEKLNRAIAAGEDPVEIIGKGAEVGRVAAQVLRQMREIKSTTAAGLASIVESLVVHEGRSLTVEQRSKLIELADQNLEQQRAYDAAARMHQEAFTDSSLSAFIFAEKQAHEADVAFQRYAARLLPVKIRDQISAFIRGNLLAVKSHVVNFFGNTEYLTLRTGAQSVAAFTDALDVYIRKHLRGQPDAQRSVLAPWHGTKAGLSGLKEGFREAGRIVRDGSPTVAGERVKTLHPRTAFMQAFTGQDMAVDPSSGKVRRSDKFKKFIEGTLGWAPEINLRLLALADAPMRTARKKQVLSELGKTRGLSGQELQKFIQFPDSNPINLVRDGRGRPDEKKSATAIADRAAKEAVFQQENVLSTLIEGGLRLVEQRHSDAGKYARTLFTTFVPYVKTPSNLAVMGVQYIMPEFALVNMGYHMMRGNRREANMAFGRAAVGYMLMSAARWLLENGVLVGDDESDRVKRLTNGLLYYGGAINISQLSRVLDGQEPGIWQPEDRIISPKQLGFTGLAFMAHANSYTLAVSEAEDEGRTATPTAIYNPMARMGSAAQAAIELPMLRGTAGIIQILENPSYDQMNGWFRQYSEVLSSVALPNTLSAFNRISWDYIPERRGDTIIDSFANVVKARLFMSDQLPLKRDLFGRPIRQNPESSTPWVHQMLDITKTKRIPGDPLYNTLYQLYESTLDPEVIPAQPQRKVRNPVTRKEENLTRKEYERYLTIIGQTRAVLMQNAMQRPEWRTASDNQKARVLKKLFDEGRERGVEAYWVQRVRPENIGRLHPTLQRIINDGP